MPSFGSGSSPFDQAVEIATSDKTQEDDWGQILEICDKVGSTKDGSRDVLRSIFKRLNHKNPTVVLKAITLLDSCVSNCGRKFAQEVSSKDAVQELRKIISSTSNSKVTEKLRSSFKKWAEGDLKSESLIVQLNNELKSGGYSSVSFDTSESKNRSSSKSKAQDLQEKEIEDLARAMALSMQEAQQRQQPTHTPANTPAGSSSNLAALYPSMQSAVTTASAMSAGAGNVSIASSVSNSNEPRKVRALYDFEAAEENELTFKTGDVIFVLDDSDANWWRGYTAATPPHAQGEGLLFPSNFVTSDLTYQPVPENTKQSSTGSSSVATAATQAQPTTVDPNAVVIDEAKIDRGLGLIQAADPTGEQRPDSDELLRVEQECRFMVPLVDAELERVDGLHAKLTDVNQALVDAFAEYHRLMAAEVSDKRQQLTMMGTVMPGTMPYAGNMQLQYYDPSSAQTYIPQYGIPLAGAPGAMPYGLPFQQQLPSGNPQMMQQPPQLSQDGSSQQALANNYQSSQFTPIVNGNMAPAAATAGYAHLPPQQQQIHQQMYSYNSAIGNGPSGAPQPQPQQFHPMPGPVSQA